MAAISTIVHPSGSGTLLFYNTKESTLALSLRDATQTKVDDEDKKTDTVSATYADTDAKITGLVNNPTSLASLYLKGSDTKLIGVYGVIKEQQTKKCDCQTKCTGTVPVTVDYGRLTLLSPAFVPLGDSSQKVNVTYGRLTGIQKPNDSSGGWLYYRSTSSTTKISRWNIDAKTSEDLGDADEASDKTYLASYYDATNNARHVLYQKSTHTTKIFDYKDEGSSALIDIGVTNAHYPAGLAAVYVTSKKQPYVYYVADSGTSSYHIYRATNSGGSWSKKKVDTDTDPNSTTQITATVLTDKSVNYIAFTNGDGNLETVQDAW